MTPKETRSPLLTHAKGMVKYYGRKYYQHIAMCKTKPVETNKRMYFSFCIQKHIAAKLEEEEKTLATRYS